MCKYFITINWINWKWKIIIIMEIGVNIKFKPISKQNNS